MLYPLLEINLSILKKNISILQKKCQEWKVEPVAVTKGFCAAPQIVQLLYDAGIRSFADSNLSNLISIRERYHNQAQYYFIRLPMKAEIDEIIQYGIIPYVSHLETLCLLDQKAKNNITPQPVILAVEAGDGREGFLSEELLENAEQIRKFSHIIVKGISTTLACLSGVLPRPPMITRLLQLKKQLRQQFNFSDCIISVGGTTFFSLWEENPQFKLVNQIRCGEAFLFGSDISRKRDMDWLLQGAFHIEAEIVEIKRKKPDDAARGFDAFGRARVNEKSSPVPRKRALVATGLQDIDETQLYLYDENVTINGATSNYLVLDCEESRFDYQVGDIVRFKAGYGAVLRAYLSPYVHKYYIE